MTKTNMDLSELLAKHDQGDFLRAIAEAVLQLLMEADVDGLIGAGRHERSGERTTWRNGYRDRELKTRLGALNLRVPKLRQGSYFPGFLEPRKTVEKALVAVIQEAWINGVSTRKVDQLVRALGGEVAFDQIRPCIRHTGRTRGDRLAATAHPLQAGGLHQTGDLVPAYLPAGTGHRVVHLAHPVDAVVLRMDPLELLQEQDVSQGPR